MSKSKKNINIIHNTDNRIDKVLILNRIKSHYNFKSKAELARFFGIQTNTLSNWYKRNILNFDLILTKCEGLNLDWLINGLGDPINRYINPNETKPSTVQEKEENRYRLIDQPEEEIERLNNTISIQEKTIDAQAKTIAIMELLITDKK